MEGARLEAPMEGARLEAPIVIRIPYVRSNSFTYRLIQRFSDDVEPAADTNNTVYTVWGLRVTEMFQELERLSGQVDGLAWRDRRSQS